MTTSSIIAHPSHSAHRSATHRVELSVPSPDGGVEDGCAGRGDAGPPGDVDDVAEGAALLRACAAAAALHRLR